jgi:hypothetical protein
LNKTNHWDTTWSESFRRLSRQAGRDDRGVAARGDDIILFLVRNDIDEGEEEKQRSQKLSLRARKQKNNEKKEKRAKQFLAFSDSRQQASFAAAFFSGFFIIHFLSQPIEIFQMILSSFRKNWLDGVFSHFEILL